jgi:ABC-type branched-subunit amino acid transport system substrate-binding protein
VSAPGSSGAAAGSPAAAPTGSTVRVMFEDVGPDAPAALVGADIPDALAVFKAAADDVNAHGGAGGHKIQVDACYDQGSPSLSAGCARQAVANHDVAVVAPLILTSDNVLPVLAQAHIPFFGAFPISPSDFSSPDSFPTTAGGVGEEAGVGYLLAKKGCKKMGVLYTAEPATEATVADVQAAAEANGAQVVAKVSLPMTSVDATSQIAQIENAGADCVALSVQNNQTPGIVVAIKQSGKSLMIGSLSGGFPSSVLKTLGSNGNGIYLTGSEALPTDTGNPAVNQMLSEEKQYEPSSPQPYTVFSVLTWADTQLLFSDVIAKITGDVTGQTVTAGIEALKNATTGVIGPYTGSTPPAVSAYPRLINYSLTFWQIENGQPQSIQSGFTDIASSLTGISG